MKFLEADVSRLARRYVTVGELAKEVGWNS